MVDQYCRLPGVGALLEPGRNDGQTKLIRDGTNVYCYGWSAANNEWVKVGDVLGASGGTQETSGKQLYNGKVKRKANKVIKVK
jgi:phospholipase A-2-activating protein